MTKYETYIFGNGRVVFIDTEIIDNAIKQGKEVLIVCNAWSGGYAYAVGAKKFNDPDFGECYNMYGYDVKEKEFNPEDLQKFYKVIFTPGEMVYMETGDQANSYRGGQFTDWHSSVADIYCRAKIYPALGDEKLTEDEIFSKRKTINERATVRNLYKDVEAKVEALIGCGILSKDATKWIVQK